MFNFRMQTVLDVRKTIEDKIISEFSKHKKELQQETENLRIIQQQKEELIDSLRMIQDKKVHVSDIAMRSASIQRRRKEEELQQEAVRNVTKKVDEKRDELLEATKKKKAMEICKTKHFERYQSAEKILERAAIDEWVITGHNRRKQK